MSDTAFLERCSGLDGPCTRDEPQPRDRARLAPGVIRIPVTPVNRDRLRKLRDAELTPWRDAGLTFDSHTTSFLSAPPADREGAAILLVLAGSAAAALLQTTAVASAFVDGWVQFREWVGYLLP